MSCKRKCGNLVDFCRVEKWLWILESVMTMQTTM